MPQVTVVAYQKTDGKVPFLEWFDALEPKVRAKCQVLLELLRAQGHELRRPHGDLLRNGIHELRTKRGRVNYRIVYFFHKRTVVVLSHGFTKQQAQVPASEIELALLRKAEFVQDRGKHTHPEIPT